jgi:pyridoxine kinase
MMLPRRGVRVLATRTHRGVASAVAGDAATVMSRPKNIISIQSHVVHGHAGNSAAVFPMQRCGVEVWPVHTVQFSNHTQYPQGFRGMRVPPEQITEIADGLAGIGKLRHCDAVLSGYLGAEAQGERILDLVRRVKEANPRALYCCDPVMGHPEKGCIVSEGVADFFRDHAVKVISGRNAAVAAAQTSSPVICRRT